MPYHQNHLRKGFSLTELSVSIAIIAMIAGSALSVALTSDFYTNTAQTNAKLDKIETALAGFVALNHRLPCPASGSTSLTASDFGQEGTPSKNGCASANFNSGTVYGGVVPIRTLQLPDDFMFDGWGRRISYAVDSPFANNILTNPECDGTTSSVCFLDTAEDSANITINDASNTPRTTHAAYVLISHGENGHGAFIKNGSTTRFNAYEDGNPWRDGRFSGELENAHYSNSGQNTSYNSVFVAKHLIRDEGSLTEYFDDITRFQTKSQIVKASGMGATNTMLYDTICRDAANIMATSINACTGAVNESDCTNFANEINKRCL